MLQFGSAFWLTPPDSWCPRWKMPLKKKAQMGEGEMCLWKKWAFQNLHRLISSLIQGKVPLMESPYTTSLVWGTDSAMHLGEDIKERSCGPCPYRNFCQTGRKKFLHMKLVTNIWGIISTRKKKCILCQTRTDNLSPYVTSSGCFRMLICSTGLGLFSPFSQKNVPKRSILGRREMKKRDKKGKLLWNEIWFSENLVTSQKAGHDSFLNSKPWIRSGLLSTLWVLWPSFIGINEPIRMP